MLIKTLLVRLNILKPELCSVALIFNQSTTANVTIVQLDGVFLDLLPSTAHPTYKHVVLTAVVGPMHCRSDGHVKNSILVHPTYTLSCRFDTLVGLMDIFRRSNGHFS